MGKNRYNSKARNISEVVIDDSATKQISVDIKHRSDDYDSCNALVLPSEKRKTKNKLKQVTTTRLLSKKKRKQLQKVVEKKQKKLQRSELLEQLSKVQVTPDELKQYVSLTALQTKGLKRTFQELESGTSVVKISKKNENEEKTQEAVVNALKGAKKKRLSALYDQEKKPSSSDPNVIGLESSDSESEISEEEQVDQEQISDSPVSASKEEDETVANNAEDKTQTSDAGDTKENHDKNVSKEIGVENREKDNTLNCANGDAVQESVETPIAKESPLQKAKTVSPLSEKDKGRQSSNKEASTPAIFVSLNRKPEIQAARMKLPVVAEEQTIVETINENPVVIVTGETGSGKTTQVPQFLYEAGYARNKLIGITEPRRVAAMSMSKRVAEEMNLTEKEVSYLIRFEGNVTPETKIKFMTDGVLLKEIQTDFLLTKYSVIILDEAHERSVYTDILIGLLSRIVPLRNKRKDLLKLIIMSATLRVEEFVENTRLFKIKPPVITVESRQFPVTTHFNRRTSEDYVTDALRKAVKIHTRLPDGGILIFLTGQREVTSVVRKLRKAFPLKSNKVSKKTQKQECEKTDENQPESVNEDPKSDNESEDDFDFEGVISRNKQRRKKQLSDLTKVNLDDYSVTPADDTHVDMLDAADDEEDHLDEDEDEDDDALDLGGVSNAQPMWVLPLYSLLPQYKQAKVFETPPEGCRLCVVATNVAETSLTIPNIKYVVDSGRCKMRMYDKVTGVSTYRVCYTSKASANQRAGRAGRTGPGHCYRLYSSAVFNDQFEQFSQSEIQRKPVDDLLLQMKVMNIDKVVNFPFPTPPDITQLKTAERRLTILGILQPNQSKSEDTYNAKVTQLGRSVAAFPVAPRYGKMLALSHQYDLLQYTICMVAALSVQEVLVEALGMDGAAKNKWLQTRRFWAGTANSLLLGDPMVLIRAIGAAEYAGSKGKLTQFCEEHGLRQKAVIEIRKLRQQLTNEINLNIPGLNLTIDPEMPPSTDMQAKLLRQIVLAGMADQVARKVSPDEIKEGEDKAKWKHAYKALEMEDPVFMHSSCVLRKSQPEWVVYQEIYETNKMYMRGITAIEPEWLPKFAPTLCKLNEPLSDPPPRYDPETGKVMCRVTGTFGRAGWQLPPMDVEHPTTIDGVKWFARFFLAGEVCPKLKRFVPSLLSTPGSITKSWSKLIPRTEAMTKQLLSQGIITRDQLLEIWSTDKKYLLSAYQKWLPESAHSEVSLLWPPT